MLSQAWLLRHAMQVVESTGVVVMPYMQYPQLLGILLHMLSDRTNDSLRLAVLTVRSHTARAQKYVRQLFADCSIQTWR